MSKDCLALLCRRVQGVFRLENRIIPQSSSIVKITKRAVDALKPGKLISDEEIKGFVVRRPGSGAITYGFRYRPKEGPPKQRWLTLGRHGNITADQARILAKKRAGEVADGRDPVA